MSDIFKIIAIRTPMLPLDLSKENREKALQVMKKIGEDSSWLFFYDDYVEIDIDNDFAEKKIKRLRRQTQASRIYDLKNIHIEVSAIVGKNGTGKSSLVDLLIRTINNLAAALVGEKYMYEAAEHLHYIENVYSDLCFELDDKFYIVEMRGRKVIMRIYSNQYGDNEYIKEDEDINILDDRTNPLEHIDEYQGLQKYIFSKFFYTLICNYSMYGFNYRDYIHESTPIERLQDIVSKMSPEEKKARNIGDSFSTEDTIWLKGLFYKNDGYQTPIVIHPMRIDGVINVNRENHLSKERLLKTFFYKNEKGEYPLRTINNNLHIQSIQLTPRDIDFGDMDYVANRLKLSKEQGLYINYTIIKEYVIQFWIKRYTMQSKYDALSEPIRKAITDYIAYKTVKIVNTYQQYEKLAQLLNADHPVEVDIKESLQKVYEDKTHRTRKLLRAIHYITEGIYASPSMTYSIDGLTKQIERAIERVDDVSFSELPYIGKVDTFLPPAIFECDFILSKGKCKNIQFAHLSSGEKQIAYTISSFLYHVSNLESTWYTKDKQTLNYKYVNVIFDEIEQYYHPDLQRCFLSYLLSGIACMDFKGLKGINILMVTHSPFVLSDIPRNNILVLRNKEDKLKIMPETFCGNINEMLAQPFFMSYAIGEVAREKLSEFIQLHDEIVKNKQKPEDIAEQLRRYKYIIKLIGDKFIRMQLEEFLADIEKNVTYQEDV